MGLRGSDDFVCLGIAVVGAPALWCIQHVFRNTYFHRHHMLDYQKLLRFSCCRRMPHFEPHGLGFRACLVGSSGFTWTPTHVKKHGLVDDFRGFGSLFCPL